MTILSWHFNYSCKLNQTPGVGQRSWCESPPHKLPRVCSLKEAILLFSTGDDVTWSRSWIKHSFYCAKEKIHPLIYITLKVPKITQNSSKHSDSSRHSTLFLWLFVGRLCVLFVLGAECISHRLRNNDLIRKLTTKPETKSMDPLEPF